MLYLAFILLVAFVSTLYLYPQKQLVSAINVSPCDKCDYETGCGNDNFQCMQGYCIPKQNGCGLGVGDCNEGKTCIKCSQSSASPGYCL